MSLAVNISPDAHFISLKFKTFLMYWCFVKFLHLSSEPSSTQSESGDDTADESGALDSPGSSHSNKNGCEAELSEHKAQQERLDPADMEEAEENSDPVSSSSNSGGEEGECPAECGSSSLSSYTEPAAGGNSIAEDTSQSSETAQDSIEQGWMHWLCFGFLFFFLLKHSTTSAPNYQQPWKQSASLNTSH